MNKLFVDLTDKPDNFEITLLPTSYSVCSLLRTKICKTHTDVNIMYYNGLKSNYKSIKVPPGSDITEEYKKLKESVTDMIKITDTFNILI